MSKEVIELTDEKGEFLCFLVIRAKLEAGPLAVLTVGATRIRLNLSS